MDTKKLASEIFSVIKEEIHKQLKNKIRNSCDVDIETYSVKRNGVNGFVIEYNHKETELLTKNEMYSVLKELDRLTNEQKKKRGWATLNVSYEEINISDNWYPANYVKLPRVISLLDKPCKEFNSLASYMEKFCGKKSA